MVSTQDEIELLGVILSKIKKLRDSKELKNSKEIYDFYEKDIDYQQLAEKRLKIDKLISDKLTPAIDEACKQKDFHEAKLIASKGYGGMQTTGLILLFRSIILRERNYSKTFL